MTVSLCIRQESERNDDSVSVEELDCVQKAAEHLWCDFKWDTNSSPNTNDLSEKTSQSQTDIDILPIFFAFEFQI